MANKLLPPLQLRFPLAFTCACIALLLYVNTWRHGYVLDDVAVIQQNRFTQQGLQGIPSMLTTFYWEGYWTSNAGIYRPLSLITFAVEQELFPGNPHVSHVVNTLLYALIAFLLFYFLSALLLQYSIWMPFIATLIFAVHPVHTEVVANIKSRDELLCFLFFIAAALAWLRWFDTGKAKYLYSAAGCYFLSLFSKEGGVSFLLVFPLLLYFFRNADLKRAFRKFWVLAVPLILFLAIHTWVIQTSDSPRVEYTYRDNALLAAPDLASRTATALTTTLHYFKLLALPYPLSHDYSYNAVPAVAFNEPRAILAIIIIAALTIMMLRGFQRRTLPSFSILYFFITFALTSNLVVPIGATMAERFLFAPSLAVALLAAFLAERYLIKDAQPPVRLKEFFILGKKPLAALAIIAVPFAFLTVSRNADWKNELTLFTADLPTVPGSAKVHYDYATVYMKEVAFKATDPAVKTAAFKKVTAELERSLQIDRNYYEAWRNLAIAAYNTGDYERSATAMQSAIRLAGSDGSNFVWLGKAQFRMNRFAEALEAFEKGIQMGAKLDDTYSMMGSAYFSMQRYKESIFYYRKALEEQPGNPENMNNLAGAYGMDGNYGEAIQLLLRSHELNPKNANTCYFLALTYNKTGNEKDAEYWAQKARELGMNI